MWLHPYGKQGWRELQRSMSWQRPGGKKNTLIPKSSCVFWVLTKGVMKTPECVLTCQGNFDSKDCYQGEYPKNKILFKEGKLQWQKQQL